MRRAVIGAGVAVALLAGAWLGAESLASRRVAQAIAADPALQATEVRALRDPRRIGIELRGLDYRDPALGISLPWARLSLQPLSPLTARLDLPGRGTILQGGDSLELGLARSEARLSLSPLNRMAPDRLNLQAEGVTLDGQPLAEGLSLQARLVSLDAAAPDLAGAAYDLQLSLAGLQTDALARIGLDPGPLPGPIAADGPLRLWLDRSPSVTGDTAPQLVGWQTEGLSLQAGEIGLRIVGRLSRDAQGRAEGQLALYSSDADAMIGLAAGLGLIPAQGQLLLRAGLSQLARAPMDASLPGPEFPDPAEGELRLPIVMRDGRLMLGGMAIGPAPAL
ncbi:DUF2125 domain-containing protein [Paracoccus liaowanqingii]|uniref:DUF2125 domain-containing protein n=1 Tax=Paracoccus liaowanqingii TaxID=2560053 RepID=A0A4P7HPK1_9RHOB|nr:DUF2125 domain-containing protein [Paracoccus liaowanqingii]QBX35201.1 DUF2125 domain-containing protein [Paracoccus liaowanqingii]